MKNSIQLSLIGLILTIGLMAFSGCDRQPCDDKDVDCGEFGNCIDVDDDAICLCESGYEKDSDSKCEVKQVAKFVGTWQARDIRDVNGSPASVTYQLEIQESPSSIVTILLDNFANLSLEDYDGNVLCVPRILGTISGSTMDIEDQNDGVSYCDAQGAALNFSGYRFSNAYGEFNSTKDTLFVEYELTYTLDDEQGNPVTTNIVSNTALTRL